MCARGAGNRAEVEIGRRNIEPCADVLPDVLNVARSMPTLHTGR